MSVIVTNALNTSTTLTNEFGDLVSYCKSFLLSRNDYVLSYIKKQINMVAHNLVRVSLSHSNPCILHDVPTTI